ncbi:hypothetical protein BCR42DRAFT_454573 [Absidia repens]|uniref:Uncharacterized protein n=1 Tax=Absidia repens TaxID=90262 RepID=A0A1X2I6S8_9FUNG|nr:hypothetical protein BCR42DRAFT_454573 [Absidia repens]
MSIATVSRSEPVPIPNTSDPASFSYKEIVRNLTANAPQPYGAIPPLMKKRKQKKKKRQSQQSQAVRRMSHVENWVAVDSKESLPDEEELIHSPFQNFLPLDFLTGILPLHMPPPSLSDPTTFIQQQEIAAITEHHRRKASHQFTSAPGADEGTISADGIFTQDGDDDDQDDEDDDLEEDDDIFDEYDDIDDDDESDLSPPGSSSSLSSSSFSPRSPGRRQRDSLGALSIPPERTLSLSPPATTDNGNSRQLHKTIVGRRSIPSFTKAHTPSTSTTTSFAMSSSPPDQDRGKWIHTIAKLRQSLALSQPPPPSTSANSFLANSPAASLAKSLPSSSSSNSSTGLLGKDNRRQPPGFIPMPLPPRRKRSTKKRRSEATTQPRFNFDTNTYTRDTRSNPDHLRMIAAELNMMRSRKLFSPLKPRGFLPRRKDPFICGDGRLRSPLQFEVV